MKSLQTLPNAKPTKQQTSDFINCLVYNSLVAIALAFVVDLIYYLLLHAGTAPGAGWLMQSLFNGLFGFSLAFISLLVWRRGGAWPFQNHEENVSRKLVNGLFLGVLLTLLVIALMYSLLAACAGDHVVESIRHLRDALLAQGEESAYTGTKIIVVAAGVEVAGKTESDPPR